ncbi:MAG: NEAT domain-containing protein [Clostridiales Family XIII bacterium]|jgi:hypothetical protein|nr:NEAT domain-containing protein [Clostridiales Family XIII bacterium]
MNRLRIRGSRFSAVLLAFALVFSLASLGLSDAGDDARGEASELTPSAIVAASDDESASEDVADKVETADEDSGEPQEDGDENSGADDSGEIPDANDNGEVPDAGNDDEVPDAGDGGETPGSGDGGETSGGSVPPAPETPPAADPALDRHNLADGWYTLKADMVKMNRRDLSMSNDAIGHDVFLSVESGSYYITLTFKGLKIDNSFGYLSSLKYYAGGYSFDKYGNVVGTPVPATVMSYQTNADGSNVVDVYNDASHPYPKDLKFPLVNRANYEGNFVPLQVFVPIMEAISSGSGTQDVLMRLDWPSLKTAQEAEVELPPTEEAEKVQQAPVDKSKLKSALGRADKIKKGKYTDVSYSMLKAAIKSARGVYDNGYSTQNEVDVQVKAIDDAIRGLKLKPKNSVKKNKAVSGRYEVRVDLWHLTQDKPSMGNAALNHTAIVDVKNGVYTMSLSTHPMQVGTITACLMSLQVKQKGGGYKYASVIARDNPDGKPSAFRFKLPSKNTYTPVKVDPRVEVMGDKPVDARLRVSWDTLVKVASDKSLSSNTGTTVSSGGEAVDAVMSDAVTLTDDATGVTVAAGDNLVPEGAGLAVSRVADGEGFDLASSALAGVADTFALFDISLTDKDGAFVQPLGNVELSIPIPEGLGGDVSVYRVNDDGTKTFIVAEVSDGKVVFNVNHFSLYALASAGLDAAATAGAGGSDGLSSAGAGAGSAGADGAVGDGVAALSADGAGGADSADSGGVPIAALIGLAAVCAAVVCGIALRGRVFRGAR